MGVLDSTVAAAILHVLVQVELPVDKLLTSVQTQHAQHKAMQGLWVADFPNCDRSEEGASSHSSTFVLHCRHKRYNPHSAYHDCYPGFSKLPLLQLPLFLLAVKRASHRPSVGKLRCRLLRWASWQVEATAE
jgi:hypothetical protein